MADIEGTCVSIIFINFISPFLRAPGNQQNAYKMYLVRPSVCKVKKV
jgi:hypothetical protein